MKLYREIPKDSTQTHLIEFSKFNKVARYKVNIQTSYFNILIMNYQKEKVIKIQIKLHSENKVPTLKSH